MTTRTQPTKLRMPARITPGCVFVSVGAINALDTVRAPVVHFLIRHMRGDWGGLTDEDWQRNEQAVTGETYLLSSYRLSNGQKLWLHTTRDRSATFVMLPAEFFQLEPLLTDVLLARL